MSQLSPSDPFSVSVIIPSHNRLPLLKRAIASVLEQTYPALEIIVIDDGSSDGTDQWLAQKSDSIVSIIQKNHGVSHARNRGIEISSAQWIAFLDSDDYWHTDKLEKQRAMLLENPSSRFCHCDEIWVRNAKRINPAFKHKKRGGYIYEHCLPLCAISPSAAVIHRSIFKDHGLFDETLPACEDYDLWLRITAREPVSYVDDSLLTKTGGHDDQLSQRYPIMDRFRLQALAKIIRNGELDNEQHKITTLILLKKLSIVIDGAKKHKNLPLLDALRNDYHEWISLLDYKTEADNNNTR